MTPFVYNSVKFKLIYGTWSTSLVSWGQRETRGWDYEEYEQSFGGDGRVHYFDVMMVLKFIKLQALNMCS